MTPTKHTVASGLISLIFAYVTKSWPGTLACFISGVMIDVDHVFDFWIARKRLLLSYQDLFQYCALDRDGKLYLIFHSYELHFLMWWAVLYFQLHGVWMGLAVGMSTHLFLDTFGNPLRPMAYFLCYRWQNNFKKECIFPVDYFQNPKKYFTK